MTREEAKRRMEICRNFLANNYSDMGEPNFTAFNMAIQALEQEPITGRWIDKDVKGHIEPYCSVCGNGLDVIYHYNYCPNCGAKMESEE